MGKKVRVRIADSRPAFVHDYMLRVDCPGVLEIDRLSFPEPFTYEELVGHLSQHRILGRVARDQGNQGVVGYSLYEMQRAKIHLMSLAVHPDYRRRGVATGLLAELVSRLSRQGRHCLTADVIETNLPAQQFFRALGFKAVGILRGEPGGPDAYRFRISVDE